MHASAITAALAARPFQTFRLVTEDGKTHTVRAPEDAHVDGSEVTIIEHRDPRTHAPTQTTTIPLHRVRRLEQDRRKLCVQSVLETAVYAEDLDAAEAFYADVLGLEQIGKEPGRHVFFRCGDAVFLVFNPLATIEGGERPAHGPRGQSHMAFTLEPSLVDAWLARLKAADVAIERDLTLPNGGRSLYFRDPAGNSIELATRRVWSLD